MLSDLKSSGYRIKPFFLWLPSPELAVLRVAMRVIRGGHAVPEGTVRRRYVSGLRYFFRIYRPLFDTWWLYDASCLPPLTIAREEQGKLNATDAELFALIESGIEK